MRSQLSNIQNQFAQALLGTKTPNTLKLSGGAHMHVYRNAYRARLEESLSDDFSLLLRQIGIKKFKKLLDDYLHAYPSQTFTLADVGVNLPKFLRGDKRYLRQPLLAEIAELDWLVYKADLAPIPNYTDFQKVLSQNPKRVLTDVLALHPSCHLLTTHLQYREDRKKLQRQPKQQSYLISNDDFATKVWPTSFLEKKIVIGIQRKLPLQKIVKHFSTKSLEELPNILLTLTKRRIIVGFA